MLSTLVPPLRVVEAAPSAADRRQRFLKECASVAFDRGQPGYEEELRRLFEEARVNGAAYSTICYLGYQIARAYAFDYSAEISECEFQHDRDKAAVAKTPTLRDLHLLRARVGLNDGLEWEELGQAIGMVTDRLEDELAAEALIAIGQVEQAVLLLSDPDMHEALCNACWSELNQVRQATTRDTTTKKESSLTS